MALNVNQDVSDPFYRYKMPRLIAKVEGKGNGIKTVIVNMPDIAKALSRPPTYPTKYFGCELGAQTQFDTKNDRYIVNGSHDAVRLQSLLQGFIKKFVLCPECSNPETNLTVLQKKELIRQRCIACGYQGNVDMRHKLTTYILKNPPEVEVMTTTPSKGKKERGKKDKHDKHKKQNGSTTEEVDADPASPDGNAQQQMAAQRARGGEIDAPPEIDTNKDDDEWGEDVTDDAIKQRMFELTDAAKNLALTDDAERTIKERLNLFYHHVEVSSDNDMEERQQSGTLQGADRDIVSEAERLEVKDKAPLILVELLLNDNILQQIKDHWKLLIRFTYENPKAQKYLIGGIEKLVDEHKATLLPKVLQVMRLLYEKDILEEEVLIDWHKKMSKKYVSKDIAQEIHDKVEPFITWLVDAEEEEDEDEDDNQVVYSTTEKVGQQKVAETSPAPISDDEDDLDIEDI